MLKIFKNLIKIIFFIFLLTFSCSKSKIIIAQYDNGVVYLKETIEEFNNLTEDKKSELNNNEGYFRFIRKVALEKIVLDKAYEAGVDKDEKVKSMIERAGKDTAYEILKKKNVVDKIVVGKDDYKKYKNRYELYQIVKRKDILDKLKIEESKNLLKKISKEINDLSTFIEYAKKYSDESNATSDGYVGKITLGVLEEVIDDEIKKLKVGEVSDVIESSMGIHILFINNIEEVKDEELYKSNELFESIYREKRAIIEEEWYKKLLKDSDLKIYRDKIKDKIYDNQIVVEYKGNNVTREKFFKIVDSYKVYYFPEPTEEDLMKLLENIGLELILEYKSNNKSIYDSKDYKEKIKEKIKFILINEYIDKNIVVPEITEEKIKEFYNNNLNTLFKFQQENGKIYIQPLDEVKKMIIQRIEESNITEARYNLYRKLIEESNLKINEELFGEFKKRIKI